MGENYQKTEPNFEIDLCAKTPLEAARTSNHCFGDTNELEDRARLPKQPFGNAYSKAFEQIVFSLNLASVSYGKRLRSQYGLRNFFSPALGIRIEKSEEAMNKAEKN